MNRPSDSGGIERLNQTDFARLRLHFGEPIDPRKIILEPLLSLIARRS
jgi:hypothetical protein